MLNIWERAQTEELIELQSFLSMPQDSGLTYSTRQFAAAEIQAYDGHTCFSSALYLSHRNPANNKS